MQKNAKAERKLQQVPEENAQKSNYLKTFPAQEKHVSFVNKRRTVVATKPKWLSTLHDHCLQWPLVSSKPVKQQVLQFMENIFQTLSKLKNYWILRIFWKFLQLLASICYWSGAFPLFQFLSLKLFRKQVLAHSSDDIIDYYINFNNLYNPWNSSGKKFLPTLRLPLGRPSSRKCPVHMLRFLILVNKS